MYGEDASGEERGDNMTPEQSWGVVLRRRLRRTGVGGIRNSILPRLGLRCWT